MLGLPSLSYSSAVKSNRKRKNWGCMLHFALFLEYTFQTHSTLRRFLSLTNDIYKCFCYCGVVVGLSIYFHEACQKNEL